MVKSVQVHPLQKWRKAKGLTLDQAAKEVGTVRQVWSDWERGRRRPGEELMKEVYRFTDGVITPNDFYDLPDLVAKRKAA